MTKQYKRILAALLAAALLVVLPAGCAAPGASERDNTLTITLWASCSELIMGALEEKFPDIHFVVNEYAGCNNSLYLKELLQRGEAGDIFFYTTFYNDTDAPSYLVDLSGYPFLTNYDKAILSTLDVGGAIYQIPGPITIRYIVVNKTLFEEKGWKIPENFDEVVAVCRQIREEEPELTPLGLGMLGMGYVWTLVTSYAQMGYLNTAQGQADERAYRQGSVSFGTVFGEGLDMVGELIDAGAFTPEKFANDWDVPPAKMGAREAAMCYVMGSSAEYTKLLSGEAAGDPAFGPYSGDEFVALPLYGRNAKNKGLILGTSNTWAISRYLEEKGNEKKLENALRVLEYISSEEGQLAIRYDSTAIPAIKNLKLDDVPAYMRDLWNNGTNSIKSFFLYTGYEHMLVETGQLIADAMYAGSSEGMKEEFIRLADLMNDEFLRGRMSSGAYAGAQADLSVEQTRKLSCEAFRAAADADFALVSESGIENGVRNLRGLSGRLFEGGITQESLTMIVSVKNVNVVSVSIRGEELRALAEGGKILKSADGTTVSFPYWLGDAGTGAGIDDDALYTVAMLDGDFPPAFAETHEIRDTGVNIIDALASYFETQELILPE